jgi:hypothetical protein
MGWRLSKRLAPVIPAAAAAVRPFERAGVRLTYELQDRLTGNPPTRRLFAAAPPALDDLQRSLVEQLGADGIAVVPLGRLIPDAAVWQELMRDVAPFVAAAAARPAPGASGELERSKKNYLVRRYERGSELSLANPWLALGASPRLLDVVNSYLRMYAKCLYVDQWYTIPGGPESERISSQRWHRDFTDQYLVKVFIYLSDVDETAGPFEYIRGSAPGGPYGRLWPWRPLGDTYPPEDALFDAVPASAAMTCLGPAGTAIFCNTSGFHRGGYATRTSRLMAVYNYASAAALASLAERNFRLGERLPDSMSPAARFALT